jgi:hypothetical protein
MEIVKTLANESAPYNPFTNYSISFNMDPAIYDPNPQYLLLPVALTETYPAPVGGGNASYQNAISNVQLGPNTANVNSQVNLSTTFIRSVRLTADGVDLYYTPNVNILAESLGVCAYDLPEERLQEYFSGLQQTYPQGLAPTGQSQTQFRTLLHSGNQPSLRKAMNLRIPVKSLLDGFTAEVKDLRKYGSIVLTIQLANVANFVVGFEPDPPFYQSNKISGEVNDATVWEDFLIPDIAGSNTADIDGTISTSNTWTSTNNLTLAQFPLVIGDTIDLGAGGNAVITNVTVSGTNKIVVATGGGLNDGNYPLDTSKLFIVPGAYTSAAAFSQATNITATSYISLNTTTRILLSAISLKNAGTIVLTSASAFDPGDTTINTSVITGVTAGATFTTDNQMSLAYFPYAIGDELPVNGAGNSPAIQSIALSAGKIVATMAQPFTNAVSSYLPPSVGTARQYKLTGILVAGVTALYPLNSVVNIYDNDSPLLYPGTSTIQYTQVGGDVIVTLSQSSIGAQSLAGQFMSGDALLLSYTGTANPLPPLLDTVADFTDSTFPLWVGQPVIVASGNPSVPAFSTVISDIEFSGGKAQLSFFPQVPASGVAVVGLSVVPQKASSIAISFPEMMTNVQYRLKPFAMKDVAFSPIYKKWSYMASTINTLSQNSSYEYSFQLEPNVDFVVLALCRTTDITSNVGDLQSYRLMIDDVDTTNRDILLSGDQTFRYERLINGYMSLSEDLDAISAFPEINPMVADPSTYVILQDIIPDGRPHTLKVSLLNGNTSVYTQRNLYLYKRVISSLP